MRAVLVVAVAFAGCGRFGFDPLGSRGPDAPILPVTDVGDGASGPIMVDGTSYTDESRAGLTASVEAGSTMVAVTTVIGFGVGDEIALIQMTGDQAGRYETHRIAAIGPGSIMLVTSLAHAFEAGTAAAQVVRIPHYTTVMIAPTGTLTGHAWDGVTGGVVFLRVQSVLTIRGTLTADALGFSGGAGGANCNVARWQGRIWRRQQHLSHTGMLGGRFPARRLIPGREQRSGPPGGAGVISGGCTSGGGGHGGGKFAPLAPDLGGRGNGIGGATESGLGGANISPGSNRPYLGGGGAGGLGGVGGARAGGGGGGGGAVTNSGPMPTDGGAGEPIIGGPSRGDGGVAGAGGTGGGILIAHATDDRQLPVRSLRPARRARAGCPEAWAAQVGMVGSQALEQRVTA